MSSAQEVKPPAEDLERNLMQGVMSEKDSVSDVSPPELSKSSAEADSIPDGGYEAWMVVAAAWCTSFCSFGWINSTLDLLYTRMQSQNY